MRVLLPLRNPTANKNASNSSLSDQSEYFEDEGEQNFFVEGSTAQQVLVEFPPHASIAPAAASVAALSESLDPAAVADPEPSSSRSSSAFPPRFLPPAGLKSCEEHLPPPPLPAEHHSLLRKRRPLEDSKPRKRPAPFLQDNKPPPQVLQQASNQNQKIMGGARRIDWRYAEQDSRDASSPESMENNPALARGDFMIQNNNSNNASNVSARSSEEDQAMEFLVALKKRGLELREQEGDGNCLFRAASLQVYGDPSMHGDVRKQCLDFMVSMIK